MAALSISSHHESVIVHKWITDKTGHLNFFFFQSYSIRFMFYSCSTTIIPAGKNQPHMTTKLLLLL